MSIPFIKTAPGDCLPDTVSEALARGAEEALRQALLEMERAMDALDQIPNTSEVLAALAPLARAQGRVISVLDSVAEIAWRLQIQRDGLDPYRYPYRRPPGRASERLGHGGGFRPNQVVFSSGQNVERINLRKENPPVSSRTRGVKRKS